MNPLLIVAAALGAGWALIWALLHRQTRRHEELARQIEMLERAD